MSKKPKIDAYQAVTDKVLELLEQGIAPWRRPWTGGGIATSLATGKEYGGINALVLPLAGYASLAHLPRLPQTWRCSQEG